MKKFFLLFVLLLGFTSAFARDNYTHDVNVLPSEAQTVLKQNFKADVSHIKIGKEFGKIRKYNVILTDGTEITFDKHGNWKDIEVRKSAAVPTAFVPNPISSYLKSNQNMHNVTGIEKSQFGYEVELSNGVELKFTEKGKFIR